MKLSLMRKLDQLSFMDMPENKMWAMIDNLFDTPRDLYEAVDWFISRLPRDHDMNGNEWFQLIDIGNVAREYNSITIKQRRLVGLLIACNWNKINHGQELTML